jgi:hypothetical protein
MEADGRAAAGLIARLNAEAMQREEHIAELDARALTRDERILALVHEVDDLHAAAEFRGVIEQAKGIIMSTMQCSADAAFAVLVAQSQQQNRKLREVAHELAAMQKRRAAN